MYIYSKLLVNKHHASPIYDHSKISFTNLNP